MISWAAIGTAGWLGVMTSISPCPLASNIAAISFIGRKVEQTRSVFISGVLYTLGRMATYTVLALIVLTGLSASTSISLFLQRYLNQILGPVLVLVGMVLLGMLGSTMSFNLAGNGMQKRASEGGTLWAAPLGVLLALSFCPVSAALFFGALIPLSASNQSRVALPLLYGLGTALPVLFFAFLVAFAGQKIGKFFKRLTLIEGWMRRFVGVVFILTGIYYTLFYIFELGKLINA